MKRRKSLNDLHEHLREILVSIRDTGDTPAERARAYLESARQSLDCFDDASIAVKDAREALRLACEGGIDPSKYRSMLFRALFKAGSFQEIVRLIDDEKLNDPESLLWRGMALFSVKGEFPALKGRDLKSIEGDTLLEYAFLAYHNGFSRLARMAASNAHSFLLGERCERVIAECYFDEGMYFKAAGLYKKLVLRERSNGALYVRYADAMAMAGNFKEACSFIEKNPPADAMLAHLITYNLCRIEDDIRGMGRALARLGLVSRGVLYQQKRVCWFRMKGAVHEARRSLERARAYIPKRIDTPPHELALAVALDCEEALLDGNAAAAGSLFPALSALPVTEKLAYRRELLPQAGGMEGEDGGSRPWSPLESPWFKAVVFLMFVLIFFLIFLNTKYGWMRP